MDQLKYDSLYSGLVSINKSLGGTQSMPDSEYGAMIDLMETLSGQPVGESGDAYDAVSTVATMAENGELPIQAPKLDSVDVDITANGRYEYQPSAYGLDGFSGFVANVNVPDSSRLGVKTVNISENGHQEFHAIDFDLDGFSTIGIDVNVPTSGGGGTKIDVGGLGLKFAYSKFSTVPDVFDFTNVVDMRNMFESCSYLNAIPQIDTSNVTDMSYMFPRCHGLRSIPLLNTSNVTNMRNMFDDCTQLTTVPQMDTSNVTNMERMFQSCSELITIPQLDMSKVTNLVCLFYGCSKLESVPLLECGNVTNAGSMFNPSYLGDQVNLTYMGGFKNLKADLNIQKAPNLTVQSLMNVINNLYDFVGNGSTTTKTLTLGTTNLNKLTDEQKAVATNKGWSLK